MKLTREPIQPGRETSLTVFAHDATNPCSVNWHHHAEYELLYLPQGAGRRHIGHHISRYEDGELLLLGPNVPHLSYGYGQAAGGSFAEVGVQFRADLLGATGLDLPEFAQVRGLLARARTGLVFAAPVRHVVGQQLLALGPYPPLEQLLTLLRLLQQLALAADYTALAAGATRGGPRGAGPPQPGAALARPAPARRGERARAGGRGGPIGAGLLPVFQKDDPAHGHRVCE